MNFIFTVAGSNLNEPKKYDFNFSLQHQNYEVCLYHLYQRIEVKNIPPKGSCVFPGSVRWYRWGVFAKIKNPWRQKQGTRKNTGKQWEKKGIVSNDNFIGFLDETLTYLHFCFQSFKMKTVEKFKNENVSL